MTRKRGWPKHKLGEVADLCLGKMLDKNKNKGELHPYLGNIHVRWGMFDLESLPEMRFEKHEHDRYGLQRGDLVVCEGGEPGRCALWKGQVPNMKIQKALHRVRPHACLDSRYLLYWFLEAGQRKYFEQYVTGATIKHLPGEKLAKIEVDVPPLPAQTKIADILSAYDDLIENNLRRIKILEEVAQSLYREWFVHFRFPGHESARLTDSSLGKIPEGWEVLEFREIFDIRYGKTLPKTEISESGPYPVYGAGSVIGFYHKAICLEKCALVTSRGNGSGTVWRTREAAFVTNNSLIILPRPNYRQWKYPFVEMLLKSSNVMSAKTGSAQPQVTIENLNYVEAIVPPESVAVRFCNLVVPLYEQIDSLFKKCQNVQQTRDFILPKLLCH